MSALQPSASWRDSPAQVDRKFDDGANANAISSLELTELAAQSDRPQPPPPGGGSFPPTPIG